ncbi:hypothetical protein P9112_013985 [Eukaryota sp. TZLM1-RC]
MNFDLPELDPFFDDGRNPFNPQISQSLQSALEGSSRPRKPKPRPKTASAIPLRKSLHHSTTDLRIRNQEHNDLRTSKILSHTSLVQQSPAIDEMITKARRTGRLNVVSKQIADNMDSMNALHDNEKKRLNEIHSAQLRELVNENEELKENNTNLEHLVTEKDAELESLNYALELVRNKSRIFEEKCMDSDLKLRLYTSLDPIFEQLSEVFSFSSPKDIIERFENLEAIQKNQYEQLSEVAAEKSRLQERISSLLQENDFLKQKFNNSETIKRSKLEIEVEQLRRQVASQESSLDRHFEEVKKSRSLMLNLQDLYEKYSENFDPEMKPNDIVNAIEMLIVSGSSSSKEISYFRKLMGLANKIWMKLYTDQEEIKGQPLQIFTKLLDDMVDLRSQLERKDKLISSLKRDKKDFHDQIGVLRRRLKSLEVKQGQNRSRRVNRKPKQRGSTFITQKE